MINIIFFKKWKKNYLTYLFANPPFGKIPNGLALKIDKIYFYFFSSILKHQPTATRTYSLGGGAVTASTI